MENLILKGLGSSLINGDIKTVDELLIIINNLNSKKENDLFDKLNITNPDLIFFIEENLLNLKTVELKDYPDYIYYFKDNICIFQYDLKSNDFFVNYNLIWSVIENKFNYNNQEISDLIKHIIKQAYKLDTITLSTFSL